MIKTLKTVNLTPKAQCSRPGTERLTHWPAARGLGTAAVVRSHFSAAALQQLETEVETTTCTTSSRGGHSHFPDGPFRPFVMLAEAELVSERVCAFMVEIKRRCWVYNTMQGNSCLILIVWMNIYIPSSVHSTSAPLHEAKVRIWPRFTKLPAEPFLRFRSVDDFIG